MVDEPTPIERRAAALARNKHKWIGLLPKVYQRFIERDVPTLVLDIQDLRKSWNYWHRLAKKADGERMQALQAVRHLRQLLAQADSQHAHALDMATREFRALEILVRDAGADRHGSPQWFMSEVSRVEREVDILRHVLEQHTLTCEQSCEVYAKTRQARSGKFSWTRFTLQPDGSVVKTTS